MNSKETVLVTGSSRGIGKAIAQKFASENFNVVINCKNSIDKLKELELELSKTNQNILAYQCDVSDYDKTKEMFDEIEKKFGGVDILVNNAGISYIGLFNEMSPDDWNTIVNTNLKSVYNCTHLALPYMIHNKNGSVINISSVWGNVGASCEVIYSSTKGAINSFTKALAKELGPSNIRINAIACGAIETEMNAFLTEDEKQALVDEISMMRFGKPEEVADMAFYISSEKANYLTGQIISLDGAWI